MKIIITSFISNGTVSVIINKNRYTYYGIDTGLYREIKRVEKYSPGKALSIIKKSAKKFKKEEEWI